MTRAALAYDRLEFKQSQQKQDFATYNEYRRLAFKAFADAADRYAQLLHAGEAKSNPEVFLLWFNAAVGASELSHLTRENITVEGSAGDDQIDRIAAAIDALPEAASFAHRAAFAEAVTGSVNALSPEVKPRVVRHALRVVRDHPSGASLRRMHELYEDLLRHEIHLRLTLDGDDRVGSLAPFGVMLSIRYTNAVARETDGFSKYLQNEVWVNFGPRSTFVNYRDKLQRGVEDALRESFDIASIAFFEPLHPSREVTEGGETGWQEKPLAYMVLKAKDASLERIPAVQMDLDFIDSSGPVILAVSSNSPPIDAGHRSARPVHDLVITQTVDVRQVGDGSKDQATLEIHASARGVVPSLDEMLTAVESALSGYAPGDSGITENPLNIAQADQDGATPYQMMVSARSASEKSYLEADADGVYRMTTERSWTITYAPQGGSTAGSAFVLPALKEGTAGKLTSRTYADMDIVEVSGPRVLIEGGSLSPLTIALLGLLLLAALLLLARALRNRAGDGNEETWADLAPHRLTPMSVLAALDRIAAQRGAAFAPDRLAALNAERVALERRCFGPGAVEVAAAELEEVARRWRQG